MNKNTPLARGWCAGIAPQNLTPDLIKKARRKASMSTPSLSTQAKFYGVNPRTVSRWRKAKIDTTSPIAVGEYLLKLRHPSPSALFAIRDSLHEQIANSTH